MHDRAQAAWQALQGHAADRHSRPSSLDELFRQDDRRAQRYSIEAAGLYLDYSRHDCTDETWQRLQDYARACSIQTAIRALFDGEPVNVTEQRPAMHMALRGHKPALLPEVPGQVGASLAQMEALCQRLRGGEWTGWSGKAIRHIVNIGIGGSNLGPAMASEALWPWHHEQLTCDFVSNIDPVHLHRTLQGLDAQSTLFIVASKSFSTAETLENARQARQWLLARGAGEEDMRHHFIAVTACPGKATAFGIDSDHVLPMHDWTGGRFSLWSGIGLPVAVMIGMSAFMSLLDGARQMDIHFQQAAPADNMPLIMALLDLWHGVLQGRRSHAILPYSQSLSLFPAFLQQLEMESLGKSVTVDGHPAGCPTGQVLWGSAGTNGQHSFHQLLHQGTDSIPADFIAVARGSIPGQEARHRQLLAHCLAQSQALMQGKTEQQVIGELQAGGTDPAEARRLAAHRRIPGNRPSSTLLLPTLDPASLGALIALYEHKVYALSVLWQINAFDQWGVELGKSLSGPLLRCLESGDGDAVDASSRELARRCRHYQQESNT